MEILLIIILLFIIYWIYVAYNWIKFKNKYPILSNEPPTGILEVGDYVSFGKGKVQYLGINKVDGFYYVFTKENSMDFTYLDQSELFEQLESVYGSYGIKWKKIK